MYYLLWGIVIIYTILALGGSLQMELLPEWVNPLYVISIIILIIWSISRRKSRADEKNVAAQKKPNYSSPSGSTAATIRQQTATPQELQRRAQLRHAQAVANEVSGIICSCKAAAQNGKTTLSFCVSHGVDKKISHTKYKFGQFTDVQVDCPAEYKDVANELVKQGFRVIFFKEYTKQENPYFSSSDNYEYYIRDDIICHVYW